MQIYLTLGDAENPFSSMNDASDNGKVIRIDRNGNAPSDNYGQTTPGALEGKLYARQAKRYAFMLLLNRRNLGQGLA
jgi:glucose/arabinose dehydrogenase